MRTKSLFRRGILVAVDDGDDYPLYTYAINHFVTDDIVEPAGGIRFDRTAPAIDQFAGLAVL